MFRNINGRISLSYSRSCIGRIFGSLLSTCCLFGCSNKPDNNGNAQSNAMIPRSKPTRTVQNNLPATQPQQIPNQYAAINPNFGTGNRTLNNHQNEIPTAPPPQQMENSQPMMNDTRVQSKMSNSNFRQMQQNNQNSVIVKVEEEAQLYIDKANLTPYEDWRENGKISYVGEMEISMTGSRPICNVKGYLELDGEEVGVGFLYGRAKNGSLHREQEIMLEQDKHITTKFYTGSAFPETSRPIALIIVGQYPDPADFRKSIRVSARKSFLPHKVYNNP